MATSQTELRENDGKSVEPKAPERFATLAGSAVLTGSRTVSSDEVDRAFGMPAGKLRERAGIESLAYVAEGEDELSLGTRAALKAIDAAEGTPRQLDWIIATSETHQAYPSLAAQLHSRLDARENCGALDVGGACLGLINGFAVAQALITSGQAQAIAVVTADVHSRRLRPEHVAGEFGGLFGDGASAFVLRSGTSDENAGEKYRLNEFLFGCATQYSGAITVEGAFDGGLDVHFDGDALSRAAISRVEKVIAAIEERSGIPRTAVAALATHQPNPRIVALIAKVAGVAPELFPAIARTCGNLGSSTCGAALHAALLNAGATPARKSIFLASLGPGLLFGGSWLSPI